MLTAQQIGELARQYETVPRSKPDTKDRLTGIEDQLLHGNPLEVAVHVVRFHTYLVPPWVQDAFLRSLECRANAR